MAGAAALAAAPAPVPAGLQWANRFGQQARHGTAQLARTLDFVGQVVQALGRLLRGRSAMRWPDLAWQLEHTGPRSVPIVALVCGLVGVILAYKVRPSCSSSVPSPTSPTWCRWAWCARSPH